MQMFELHGYMRMRGDYFHRLDLGMSLANAANGSVSAGEPDLKNKFFPPPAKHAETLHVRQECQVNKGDVVTHPVGAVP